VGAEVDFEFIDKDFEVPHPMHGVGRVHEPWFKPTHRRTVQVWENEEDFLLVIGEGVRAVSEVEVTGDQKTAEFPRVQTVKGVWVADFDFFRSWGRRWSLVGCDTVCQLSESF
jgi:hypothetical protein